MTPTGVYRRTTKHKRTQFKKGLVPWNKGKKFPGRVCPTCFQKGNVREKSPSWKGGKVFRQDGYVMIYAPDHPFCDKHGYVREHRLVVEERLGRYLKPTEVVHHENGVPNDNRDINLRLFSGKGNSEHRKYHESKKRSGQHEDR